MYRERKGERERERDRDRAGAIHVSMPRLTLWISGGWGCRKLD